MQALTLEKFRPMGAYMVGSVLTLSGIAGLLLEFRRGSPSWTNFQGYVLAAAFIVSGVLTCGAAKAHYGGGLLSFIGLICAAAVIFRCASALQVEMRGGFVLHQADFYYSTAGLSGVGFYCLIWGHMRRHKQKKACFHDNN